MSLLFKNNNDFLEVFKNRLKEFTGAKYVVLTDSCSNAIFLSLKYLQKNSYIPIQSTELLIPNRTYLSVPQSIINAGFTPIFNDKKWKGKYKIGNFPIYDCAVGFKPGMYKAGQYQCLSFQQKKALPIGKGGAILLDNYDAYVTLSRMAWDGRDSSIPVKDDKNIIHGYHMNMIPDDAARGILLLNQFEFNKRQIKSYKDYPDLSKN
jgi:dTDP-4-amino-4,6-dideoxygalactose transaminase